MTTAAMSPPPKHTLMNYSSPPPKASPMRHSPAFNRGGPKTPPSILKMGKGATYGGSARSKRGCMTDASKYDAARTKKLFLRYRNSNVENRGSPSLPGPGEKKCSGHRLKWTSETPTRNARSERVIRRLTRNEKKGLYDARPDLDPAKGGVFDMGAWMDGDDQEEDDDYMEDDDLDLMDEENDYEDAHEDEDQRIEKENRDSFLDRLLAASR